MIYLHQLSQSDFSILLGFYLCKTSQPHRVQNFATAKGAKLHKKYPHMNLLIITVLNIKARLYEINSCYLSRNSLKWNLPVVELVCKISVYGC